LICFWPFGNLVAIWYIFRRFGILCQKKSGNPGDELHAVSRYTLSMVFYLCARSNCVVMSQNYDIFVNSGLFFP
jgi:hypothetical protein